MHIVSAVIPQSAEHLRTTLALVRHFASDVQIDLVDGDFVPPISWPYGAHQKEGSPELVREWAEGLAVEVDLMVAEPEKKIDAWVAAGVGRFVVHAESTQMLDVCIKQVKTAGRVAGLSLNNDTPLDDIAEWIPQVDFVQCMGIAEIGMQGNPFDVRVLERIRTLRADYPELEIAVDGSVNEDTLPQLIEAGADRCAVGSAIFGAADPATAFQALQRMSV